jgi:hypothetical protein
MLETRYKITVRYLETDNELRRSSLIRVFLHNKAIKIEECAPRTQQQNGSGERSGGMVKEKTRLLAIDSNLPKQLWPELVRTAVYLLNRTPKAKLGWKTPYQSFFSTIPTANPETKAQPRVSHLKTIGCKAFVMNKTAQLKTQRLKSRLDPKAWIGYLVGYNSQNIFRVWNPVTNSVYITRDVIFNEKESFDPNEARMRETIGEQTLEEIQERLQSILQSQQIDQVIEPTQQEDELETEETNLEQPIDDLDTGGEPQEEEGLTEDHKYLTYRFAPLLTPPKSPAATLLINSIESGGQLQSLKPSGNPSIELNQAFCAASLIVPLVKSQNEVLTKAIRNRFARGKSKPKIEAQTSQNPLVPQGQAYHRKQLPAATDTPRDLQGHKFEREFKQAEIDHLESHRQMKTWIEISRFDSRVRDSQILDCMWRYTYKFNKHGYLRKCKARLVVRGDQ